MREAVADSIPPLVVASDLASLIQRRTDVRVLDVRTAGEFEGGHIPSAYNVPLDTLGEHGRELRHVDAPVVLVCRSGQRARKAEAALRESGMASLHVLDGGMLAWEAADLEVRRPKERWHLERQVRLVAGSIVFLGAIAAWLLSPAFLVVPAFIGGGLAFAALTDTCAMGMLLAKLPYNKAATTCDVGTMVQALKAGTNPMRSTLESRVRA